jgi:hypothetical protein
MIEFPSSLESLGNRCFDRCKSLSEVKFQSGSKLKRIGWCAFSDVAVGTIRIPASVESVGCDFVSSNSSYEVFFESGSKLKSIERFVSRIRTIRIPSSIEIICKGCLQGHLSLREVTFESGSKLWRIETSAFGFSGLKTIQLPSSVEYIGEDCFFHCRSLREVTFEPESRLRYVGRGAFDCTLLKTVQIPSNPSLQFISPPPDELHEY